MIAFSSCWRGIGSIDPSLSICSIAFISPITSGSLSHTMVDIVSDAETLRCIIPLGSSLSLLTAHSALSSCSLTYDGCTHAFSHVSLHTHAPMKTGTDVNAYKDTEILT